MLLPQTANREGKREQEEEREVGMIGRRATYPGVHD
jgi:hypothetical protein